MIAWIDEFLRSHRFISWGTSAPGWSGTNRNGPMKRSSGKGFGRKVKAFHPLNMNREIFDTQAARDDRFRELKGKKTPDLCRGILGEKYYVAFR
jgi:hypothetical protein